MNEKTLTCLERKGEGKGCVEDDWTCTVASRSDVAPYNDCRLRAEIHKSFKAPFRVHLITSTAH